MEKVITLTKTDNTIIVSNGKYHERHTFYYTDIDEDEQMLISLSRFLGFEPTVVLNLDCFLED